MAVSAVPRVEESGSHPVVAIEVGDLRQVIAAFGGVATLARAQGVGPRALREALPELRTACLAAPAIVAGALLASCDVVALSTGLTQEAHAALDGLVIIAREGVAGVRSSIDACERKGVGAKTRLSLQAACDHAVETLTRVRWAVELLQRASVGEPVPVAIDDLLREVDRGEVGGPIVELAMEGDLDVVVAVQPWVATAVLAGMLGRVVAADPSVMLVVTVTSVGDRVRVACRRGPPPAGAATLRLTVADPCAVDDLVLQLAAATIAAPLVLSGADSSVELLRV